MNVQEELVNTKKEIRNIINLKTGSLPQIQSTVNKLEQDLDIVLDLLQTEMATITNNLNDLNEGFFEGILNKVLSEVLSAKENEFKEYFDLNFQKIE